MPAHFSSIREGTGFSSGSVLVLPCLRCTLSSCFFFRSNSFLRLSDLKFDLANLSPFLPAGLENFERKVFFRIFEGLRSGGGEFRRYEFKPDKKGRPLRFGRNALS
jgi:hypothetical protein